MEIADHYNNYAVRTLITLTNHAAAKIYQAENGEVELVKEIRVSDHGYDDAKEREVFYSTLNSYLEEQLHHGVKNLVVCAPGAFVEDLQRQLSPEVQEVAGDIVPKNLVSLDIEQVLRILSEGQVDNS